MLATDAETRAEARLADLKANPIRSLSQQEAKFVLSDLKDWAKSETAIASLLAEDSAVRHFIVAAFSLSPFLRDTARIDPSLLAEALVSDLRQLLGDLTETARQAWRGASEAELMTALRKAKRRAAFLIALGDLRGLLDGRQATDALTGLAEAAVAAAIDHLLFTAHEGGKLRLPEPEQPSQQSGVIVLGMGKLGGRELNYSSDIELVVF